MWVMTMAVLVIAGYRHGNLRLRRLRYCNQGDWNESTRTLDIDDYCKLTNWP